MEKRKEDLLAAVWKKAMGYTTTESVEEYSVQDGQLVVNKQKVTTKEMAPDITAAKLIIEQAEDELEVLSDEELLAEKKRLLGLLEKEEKCGT